MLSKGMISESLNKFAKGVIQQSRSNLSKSDKNVSKKLYQSLGYKLNVSKNSFGLEFEMEEYGQFQDQGVKGALSSSKAPNSPFKFGSGTGRKGGLSEGILAWVKARRFQFRNRKNGKFMSYESTANLITKSVYQKGIKPSLFFTKPFEQAFNKLPDELIEAYGLEVDNLFKAATK